MTVSRSGIVTLSLNAPYGARCFLTGNFRDAMAKGKISLNAPYGARCFLTVALLLVAPRRCRRS